MKILYVFPEEMSGRFAREYHVYRLAESLAAAGCEVTLAAAPSPQISSAEDLRREFGGSGSPRLRLLWLKREMKLGPITIRSGGWFYRQLDWHISSEHFDAVYTMHLKAADHIVNRQTTVPVVFEAHEIFADSHPANGSHHRRLFGIEKRLYTQVRGVVAISGYLGRCLRERMELQAPLHVQHDGIDEATLTEDRPEPDPHELIYLGSLQPWKGVPVAIAAMRRLPEYHLTVLGGEGDKLQELRASAPANVTFHGKVARDEMGPHLQRASIGLMPNLLEPRSALSTFPLKLLEYSAAGKGIVASRIPAFDDLNVAAWVELVPSGSPEALADGVRALAQRKIDRGAARAWAGQFAWERQGATLKRFLESVLR